MDVLVHYYLRREICREQNLKLKDDSLFNKARQDCTIMIDLDPTTEVQMAPILSALLMFWKAENGQ